MILQFSIIETRTTAVVKLKSDTSGRGTKGFLEGERGADMLLVVPESQAAFDYGMKLLENHGVAVLISFLDAGFRVSPHDLVFRDIKIDRTLWSEEITRARSMLKLTAKTNI